MRAALAPLVFWALGCAALQPKPGASCEADAAVCSGQSSALVCRAGHYASASCPGPEGCKTDKGRNVACDQSRGAKAGELCLPDYEGQAQCAPEESGYLTCREGLWVHAQCASGACAYAGDSVICQ